jgi:hypothetical protein
MPPRNEIIELQATHLALIKKRAKGEKGSVHKKAMRILQTEHEQLVQRMQAEVPEKGGRIDAAIHCRLIGR